MSNHPLDTSIRVLIAEDNLVFGELIRFNLEKAGCNCTLVTSGDAAVTMLGQQKYQVLITDCDMPRVSGVELIRIIREDLKDDTLKIVMCTARAFELDAPELTRRFDLVAILHKPFSVRKLIDIVAQSQ